MVNFFPKKILIKMFLWTGRMGFLQSKTFCSLSKIDRQTVFSKKFSLTFISSDVKRSFLNPAQKSLPEGRDFFRSSSGKKLNT